MHLYACLRVCIRVRKRRETHTCARIYIRVKTLGVSSRETAFGYCERRVLLMQPHDREIAMRYEETETEEDSTPRRGAPSRVSP